MREIVTFSGVASPTQCLIRREWPIVGFCAKLVVAGIVGEDSGVYCGEVAYSDYSGWRSYLG